MKGDGLNIALLVNAFPLVSETFIANQIEALKLRGHNIDVYPSECNGENRKTSVVRVGAVSVKCVHGKSKSNRKWWKVVKIFLWFLLHGLKKPSLFGLILFVPTVVEFRRFINRLYSISSFSHSRTDYDIVFAHFGPQGVRAVDAIESGLLNGALVVFFHGYDVTVYPKSKGVDVYEKLFDKASRLLVSSRYMVSTLAGLGAPGEKISRIQLGVDVDKKFSFAGHRVGCKVRIISVCRLVEFKGIEYGLRSLSVLAKLTKYPLEYRIIGDGVLRGNLEEVARTLGVDHLVTFLGALPSSQVVEHLQSSDIYLAPGIIASDSAVETQGIALLEAQACGLPVVATNVGGMPESVVDGRSGFIVEQRDIAKISKALQKLVENESLRRDMGCYGRSLIARKFNAIDEYNKLEQLLREIAESN